MANHYETLGVPEDADEVAIKKAYRRLAVEWHPDKHQGKETHDQAEEKFKGISEAYSILSDAERKKAYDLERKGGTPFKFHTTGDPFDFQSFFSSGMPFGFRRPQGSPQPRQGQHIQMEQPLTLSQSLFGVERTVEYLVKVGCEECGMRGAKVFEVCPACKGTGFSTQQMGNTIMQSTCVACRGQASFPKEPCPKCQGQKLLDEHKRLTVAFPPGLRHGATLRLRGAGGPGFLGGPAGDVLIQVRVEYPDLNRLGAEDRENFRKSLVGLEEFSG